MLFGLSQYSPRYNWDMIGYIAAVEANRGLAGAALHRKVFADIERQTPEKNFVGLTTGSHYEEEVFRSPEALQQQVPFYRARVLYLLSLDGLSRLGVDIVASTHLVSGLFVLSGLALFSFFAPVRGSWIGLAALAVAAVVFRAYLISRNSSPDGMSFFFVVLTVFLLMRNVRAALLVAAVLPLVRENLVIFSVLLNGFVFLSDRGAHRGWILASTLASISIYLATKHFVGGYGYQTVFMFTFVEISPYPADRGYEITWPVYLARLWFEIEDAFLDTLSFQVFLGLILVSVALRLGAWRVPEFAAPPRRFLYLVVLPGTYVFIHFMAFPAMWSRFFTAVFMLPLLYVFEHRRLGARLLQACRRGRA